MNIILYTIDCPKCNVLKKKLDNKNVPYVLVNDIEQLRELESDQFPQLMVDNVLMDYHAANGWINNFRR